MVKFADDYRILDRPFGDAETIVGQVTANGPLGIDTLLHVSASITLAPSVDATLCTLRLSREDYGGRVLADVPFQLLSPADSGEYGRYEVEGVDGPGITDGAAYTLHVQLADATDESLVIAVDMHVRYDAPPNITD